MVHVITHSGLRIQPKQIENYFSRSSSVQIQFGCYKIICVTVTIVKNNKIKQILTYSYREAKSEEKYASQSSKLQEIDKQDN